METYTITLTRRFLWGKKLKKVKVHFYPDDMNPKQHLVSDKNGKAVPISRENRVKFMIIIFEDERRRIINLDEYKGYEISKEFFFIEAKKAERESQGQAKVASPLK